MSMKYGCGCLQCQAIAAAWREPTLTVSPRPVSTSTRDAVAYTIQIPRDSVIYGCILDDTANVNTDVRHALTPKAPHPATHDATVTLPYGFTLPIPSASEKKQDELKEAEDQILGMFSEKPRWFQASAYKYLHNLGLRMNDVDDLIRRRAK